MNTTHAHDVVDQRMNRETAHDLGLGAGLAPDLELCNPYPYAAPEHGAWEQGRATGEALRAEHLLGEVAP